jgi:hypothetical protein
VVDTLLSFFSKRFDITARVGVALALFALTVFVMERLANIQLVAEFDKYIFLAGGFGACLAAYDILFPISKWLKAKVGRAISKAKTQRLRKHTALENMKALSDEYVDTLHYLKSRNTQRFHAPVNNTLLYEMQNACLLEIDDPNWTTCSIITYYKVPDYVWEKIDHFGSYATSRPISQQPPWLPERV